MAASIELQGGESIVKEFQGDYWKKMFAFVYSQKRGRYWITNRRIVFQGGFATELSLSYSDIAEVKKCLVGPCFGFLPTGIKVTMKNGEQHRLSVLSRKKTLELIQQYV